MRMMRYLAALALALMMIPAALADVPPVKMEIPPEAIPTQAEGELEMYDLTFPEDMPLTARNFVLLARAQFEKHPFEKLPKANDYTHWYYEDDREIGYSLDMAWDILGTLPTSELTRVSLTEIKEHIKKKDE